MSADELVDAFLVRMTDEQMVVDGQDLQPVVVDGQNQKYVMVSVKELKK